MEPYDFSQWTIDDKEERLIHNLHGQNASNLNLLEERKLQKEKNNKLGQK